MMSGPVVSAAWCAAGLLHNVFGISGSAKTLAFPSSVSRTRARFALRTHPYIVDLSVVATGSRRASGRPPPRSSPSSTASAPPAAGRKAIFLQAALQLYFIWIIPNVKKERRA
jgi:hypothetical protein